MSVRTAITRLWKDYFSEFALSLTIVYVLIKFAVAISRYDGESPNCWIVQICVYMLLLLVSLICLYNTAVTRVMVQEVVDRDRKGGL